MSKKHKKKKHHPKPQAEQKAPFRWSVFYTRVVQYSRLGLVLAVLYVVVMLGVGLTYHTIGDYGIETDFFWSYVPEAQSALEGHIEIDQFRGPLYPLVLAGMSLPVGDFFKAGMLIGILSAGVVIFLTYRLVRKLFGESVAFFTTLLMALNPYFIQYSYSAGTDMFFSALVLGILYLLLIRDTFQWWRVAVAGVLCGLAYLTRYNALFIIAAVPAAFLFINPFKITWKKRIIGTLLFLMVFFAVITPWGLYCLHEEGNFFYNRNFRNIGYELYGKGKMSWDAYWQGGGTDMHSLSDVILKDPAAFLGMVGKNVADHFVKDMGVLMGWPLGVFILIGLVFIVIRKPTRREWMFYLYHVFFFGVLLVVFYSERFSLFLIGFYAVLALTFLIRDEHRVLQRLREKRVIPVVILLLVGWMFIRSYQYNRRVIDSGPKEVLTVAEWFRANVPASERGARVSARKPHIAYYLGLEFIRIPYVNTAEALIEELRKEKVDYLYFSMIEAAMRREMQGLLDPRRAPQGLVPVVYTQRPPSVLYRVQ